MLTSAPRGNLPAEVETRLTDKTIGDIKAAAFGDTADKYFVRYSVAQNPASQGFFYGDDNPKALNEYLRQRDAAGKLVRDLERLKVAFGPGDSFFAWDGESMRWGSLPAGLETSLQSWLSPAGWKAGPPRMVALGVEGSYFVMSEYGSVAYQLSGKMKSFNEDISSLEAKKDFAWSSIEVGEPLPRRGPPLTMRCSTSSSTRHARRCGFWC